MPHSTQPSFAGFVEMLALARGFDRGDDDERFAACRVALPDLTPYGWRLYGVLACRRGDFDLGATALTRAIAGSDDPHLDQLLQAWAAVRAGQATEAVAFLDTLMADRQDDPSFAPTPNAPPVPDVFGMLEKLGGTAEQIEEARTEATVGLLRGTQLASATLGGALLARGDALWTLGRLDEAEAAYRASSEHTPMGAAELVRLLVHTDQTAAALEVAESIADDAWAARELVAPLHVALVLDARGLDEAVTLAQSYGLLTPSLRDEPGLAPLLAHPEVQAVVQPDLSWLSAFPALAALRDDDSLAAAGCTFVDEATGRSEGEALARYYAGTFHLGVLWSDALFGASGEAAAGKVLIATGPQVVGDGFSPKLQLFADLERPDMVFLLPQAGFPAALMVEVEARAAAVLEALEGLVAAQRIPRVALPSQHRAFLGYLHRLGVPNPYTGQLEVATPLALERHFTMSPSLGAHFWGSSQADDPWPDSVPPQPNYMLKINDFTRQVRQQEPGATCTFTWRTQFSRSHVSLELHDMVLVADVRYHPSPFTEVVGRLNERLGTTFPTDLPLDVVVALYGFDHLDADSLRAALAEAEPQAIPAYLEVIAAVGHSDLDTMDWLRDFARHPLPAVRGAVYDMAARYNWRPLLLELVEETDPDLRPYIDNALRQGFAPPEYDDLGEPVGLVDRLEGAH